VKKFTTFIEFEHSSLCSQGLAIGTYPEPDKFSSHSHILFLYDQFGYCLPPAFMLISCLAYSSTLKMEVTCSSEMSVEFQQTTGRYIPEDRNLQFGYYSPIYP
jgi:hypothetical protein